MKQKIIRAFLAVYLVLSIAYGGIRAAYITVMAAVTPLERTEEPVVLADSFGVDVIPVEPEQSAATASAVIQAEDLPEDAASGENAAPDPEKTVEASSPEADAAESVWEEPIGEVSVYEETPEANEDENGSESMIEETPAEEVSAYEEIPEVSEYEEDDEESYIEEAPAEDIPSLDEYLSTLHCGGCGRNCYLSSPRCRTGRSKAESETSAYYELYDVSGEI